MPKKAAKLGVKGWERAKLKAKRKRRKHTEARWAILVKGNLAFPESYFLGKSLYRDNDIKTFETRRRARYWKRRSLWSDAYKKRWKIVRVDVTERG